MNIHICSFASKSFLDTQKKQEYDFLKLGFNKKNIHLYNPELLDSYFYNNSPNASEENKYGWFSFKPFFISSILDKLQKDDFLVYMDVYDKPKKGLQEYLVKRFKRNRNLDILVNATNYPNIKFLSNFHKRNLSFEFKISSIFNSQPEAGVIVMRNNPRAKSILRAWYGLTFIQSIDLNLHPDNNTRHDQETLFILSRIYKSIKIDSWLKYKLFGKGLRKFIDYEGYRKN